MPRTKMYGPGNEHLSVSWIFIAKETVSGVDRCIVAIDKNIFFVLCEYQGGHSGVT